MATFLVRMFGYTAEPATDPFHDDDGSAHERNINRLYVSGVTTGCAQGLFCPKHDVTRGQMATFLTRALGLRYGAGNDWFADDDGTSHEANLDRLYFAGITRGCGSARVCPTRVVTRGQMAALLHRASSPAPIAAAGFSERVSYATPITVEFVGPARFRGVTFSSDGASASLAKRFGTIARVTAAVDRSKMVSGVRYAHVSAGPLQGAWVKVTETIASALGRAPRPPACRYDDVLTSRRAYDQYAITLLDTIYKLPSTYAPGDLVDTGTLALNSGYRVRKIVASNLKAMAADARAAGATIRLVSAYRSYAQQKTTFDYWVSVSGYQQALLTSARAGHSEHQLGTTVDVTSLNGSAPWDYADWATTTAGAWMTANAWRYGFVMTYPKGRTDVTCYAYEPWHYRYVGKPIASAVRTSGMSLREAIWAAYGP
jgi:D-alanyl-D-alanine carboxypeptidase